MFRSFAALLLSLSLYACTAPMPGPLPSPGPSPTPFETPLPNPQPKPWAITNYALLSGEGLALVRMANPGLLQLRQSATAQFKFLDFPGEAIDSIQASPDLSKLLLVSRQTSEPNSARVYLLKADGTGLRQLELPHPPIGYGQLYWFPDGQELLYASADASGQVLWYRHSLTRSQDQLVSETRGLSDLLISPDGQQILASVTPASGAPLYPFLIVPAQTIRLAADGSVKLLTPEPDQRATPVAWYPDSKKAILAVYKSGAQSLLVIDAEGRPLAPISDPKLYYWSATPSPDGQSLLIEAADSISDAISSDQQNVVLVARADGSEPVTLGSFPRTGNEQTSLSQLHWSPDAKSVWYLRAGSLYRWSLSERKASLINSGDSADCCR
ncbi:MAG: TolB family protein [Candidatus Sericytochromatia bacterium]